MATYLFINLMPPQSSVFVCLFVFLFVCLFVCFLTFIIEVLLLTKLSLTLQGKQGPQGLKGQKGEMGEKVRYIPVAIPSNI